MKAIFAVCVAIAALNCHGQNVFDANMQGQPLVYMDTGTVVGCRLR